MEVGVEEEEEEEEEVVVVVVVVVALVGIELVRPRSE